MRVVQRYNISFQIAMQAVPEPPRMIRRPLPSRWKIALMGTMAMHGLAIAFLSFVHVKPDTISPADTSAVSVVFAPSEQSSPPEAPSGTSTEATPSPSPPTDLSPAEAEPPPPLPPQTESPPLPEPQPEPPPPPPPEPQPEPAPPPPPEPQPEPAPSPPPEPQPEPPPPPPKVRLPRPPPVEHPKPAGKPVRLAPKASTPPTMPGPATAEPASAGTTEPASAAASQAAADSVSAADLSGWRQSLAAWIARHKIYPDEARRQGIEGTVALRFSLDSTGKVAAIAVLHGSGSAILDAAAEAMLTGATLPAPPPGLRVPAISVQVHYALRD